MTDSPSDRCGRLSATFRYARAFCGLDHSFADRLMIKILNRGKKALWIPNSPTMCTYVAQINNMFFLPRPLNLLQIHTMLFSLCSNCSYLESIFLSHNSKVTTFASR